MKISSPRGESAATVTRQTSRMSDFTPSDVDRRFAATGYRTRESNRDVLCARRDTYKRTEMSGE